MQKRKASQMSCPMIGQSNRFFNILRGFGGLFLVLFLSTELGFTQEISDSLKITEKNSKGKKALFVAKMTPNQFKKLLGVYHPEHRSPSSFIPDEEIITVPVAPESWFKNLIIEDDSGVLVTMRNELDSWYHNEIYAQEWGLESTGLYPEVTEDHKTKFLRKHTIKYIDKRLSGEIKKAEKGSTLEKIGKVEKALKPSAQVQVSKEIKVKLRARVLQREATMVLYNPYMDLNTFLNYKGKVDVNAGKSISTIGARADVNYRIKEKQWVAAFTKTITSQISTRVSSTQSHKTMAFTDSTDRKVELNFSHAF